MHEQTNRREKRKTTFYGGATTEGGASLEERVGGPDNLDPKKGIRTLEGSN